MVEGWDGGSRTKVRRKVLSPSCHALDPFPGHRRRPKPTQGKDLGEELLGLELVGNEWAHAGERDSSRTYKNGLVWDGMLFPGLCGPHPTPLGFRRDARGDSRGPKHVPRMRDSR